ncbi:hypothetical protein MKZ38_005060 [Zalerion maritima]|uniref:Uncharacterized protein n=1 Tax=Zalerion maritima TaxID=339359 RepID=A0AAD5WQL3_9PEZI|nr:hypothetical protein MKZ38_005060 [Zalerion maritima]
MPSDTAPSAGQKVTLGSNAPTTSESAGRVTDGSLAAESSTFQSSNRNAESESVDPSSAPFRGEPQPSNQGAPAPTYVNSQYKDTAGPHGKNLTEGGFRTDVRENKSFTAEIGAKDDPSRAAIHNMELKNEAGVPGKGAKQYEVESKSGEYDALKNEVES